MINIHKGKRGFIIGGGPSISLLQNKGFDFSKLHSEITLGVNLAYRIIDPTYLVFADNSFYARFREEIENLNCKKFFNKSCSYRDKTTIPLNIYSSWREKSTNLVPHDFSRISFWNNSGVSALRIAYLLGLDPIYLIGIDVCLHNNKSHFHDEYKILSRHYPAHRFKTCFNDTCRGLQKQGITIYSCSPISKLKSIKYIDITTLF